jgi:hypothetical protein
MCLWEQGHIHMYVLQLFTGLVAQPQMPFVLHAMISSGLWNTAAILFH